MCLSICAYKTGTVNAKKYRKLLDTYMLVGAGLSRVKYEIFTGDEGSYAFITIYAYEPHFHIKGYDSLKLDETVDVRSQIEGHFAYTYQ